MPTCLQSEIFFGETMFEVVEILGLFVECVNDVCGLGYIVINVCQLDGWIPSPHERRVFH